MMRERGARVRVRGGRGREEGGVRDSEGVKDKGINVQRSTVN